MPLRDSVVPAIINAILKHLKDRIGLCAQDGQIFKWDAKQNRIIGAALCTLDNLSASDTVALNAVVSYFQREGMRRDLVWLKIFQEPELSDKFILLSYVAICKSDSTDLKKSVTTIFVKNCVVTEQEIAGVSEKNEEYQEMFGHNIEPSEIAMSLLNRMQMTLSSLDITTLAKIDAKVRKFNVAIDGVVESAKATLNTMLDNVAGLDNDKTMPNPFPLSPVPN